MTLQQAYDLARKKGMIRLFARWGRDSIYVHLPGRMVGGKSVPDFFVIIFHSPKMTRDSYTAESLHEVRITLALEHLIPADKLEWVAIP